METLKKKKNPLTDIRYQLESSSSEVILHLSFVSQIFMRLGFLDQNMCIDYTERHRQFCTVRLLEIWLHIKEKIK